MARGGPAGEAETARAMRPRLNDAALRRRLNAGPFVGTPYSGLARRGHLDTPKVENAPWRLVRIRSGHPAPTPGGEATLFKIAGALR
jgi:hypothetical protein